MARDIGIDLGTANVLINVSGKGSDRTRRPIHKRFQSNQCQFLLVRPAKHDNQNRARGHR